MTSPAAVVTGAPGWLGTRLVLALAQGLPEAPGLEEGNPDRLIRCLVHGRRDSSPLKEIKGRLELVPGDLSDPASLTELFKGLAQPVVFHCAGVIHPRRASEFFQVNTQGTRNLVAAAISAGAKRFIHVSSTSPMGFNPGPDQPFDETSPYQPQGNYGKSKKLAEDIVNQAGRSGKIETVIARAPWYYGPGQPERQTRFFRMIKTGAAPVAGRGDNLRSLAYVDNLCQGLILCERVGAAAGKTFWIADRKPYTMNEIVDTIERVMKKDFSMTVAGRRRKIPGLASGVALVADETIQALGFYQPEIHVLSELNKNIFCSIAQAEKELGYDPKIDLEEGMKRSVKWLLEHKVEI